MQTEDAIEVRADIPGIPKEDINVCFLPAILTPTLVHAPLTVVAVVYNCWDC